MFGKLLNLLDNYNSIGIISFAVNGQILTRYSSHLVTLNRTGD